ncbi:hypothetical protein BGZ72_003179, partial [Mortierella alpina]
ASPHRLSHILAASCRPRGKPSTVRTTLEIGQGAVQVPVPAQALAQDQNIRSSIAIKGKVHLHRARWLHRHHHQRPHQDPVKDLAQAHQGTVVLEALLMQDATNLQATTALRSTQHITQYLPHEHHRS